MGRDAEWERGAAPVHGQVRDFIEISEGCAVRLTREQKGRFVAICWTAQMCKHLKASKPGHVADRADLPAWQRETGSDIFEHIKRAV